MSCGPGGWPSWCLQTSGERSLSPVVDVSQGKAAEEDV